MPDILAEDEAEDLILWVLGNAENPLSTKEIEEIVSGRGKQCPDSAVKFLTKMRYKGMIMGKLSIEHRGWIWWKKKGE